MSALDALRSSLALLRSRDRWKLVMVVLTQIVIAGLDLIGVLLLGLVVALGAASLSNSGLPTSVESFISHTPLADSSTQAIAGTLAVIAGAALIIKSLVSLLLTQQTLRFLASRQADVARRIAEGLLSSPLSTVRTYSSQQTSYALTGGVSLATLTILGQGTTAIAEAGFLLVFGVGLFVVNPFLTVFAILYFAIFARVLHSLIAGKASRLGVEGTDLDIRSIALIQEAIRAYREIYVADRRKLYAQRFYQDRRRAATVQAELQLVGQVPRYVLEIALIIGSFALAGSQLLWNSPVEALSTLTIFLVAGARIVPSIQRFQGSALTVRSAAGGAALTYAIARKVGVTGSAGESSAEAKAEKEILVSSRAQSDIELNDISFTYPDADAPTLRNINMKILHGSSVAIVGRTGSGKTTLVDLILGVLEPTQGEVLVGGLHPSSAISLWAGSLAYCPQDVFISNGTVRDNVALGLPRHLVDDERVWEALRRAHLEAFLQGSTDGLDTEVGEGGVKFSGGQRQRLGMARAFYTRPNLIVLDEATSALDVETESAIVTMLRELEGDVTVITIAHRLSTVRHCTQVVYLEDGEIAALGSFEEVRQLLPNFDAQATLLGLE